MKSRIRTRKKTTREQALDSSAAPAQPMFQSRPFVVQSQSTQKSQQQPDLKTSLRRAQRYGHHLDRMRPTVSINGDRALEAEAGQLGAKAAKNQAVKVTGLVQTKPSRGSSAGLVQEAVTPIQKRSTDDGKEKKAQQGGKTVDYGSSLSNTASDTASGINTSAAGGVGGLLKLPMAGLDLHEAYKAHKAGDKSQTAASGVKGIAGLVEGSANLAKFGGDAVSALGVGVAGGTAGAVTGLVDAGKGISNVVKAKGGYRQIKDTARDAANRVGPVLPSGSKRKTEELREVLKDIPNQINAKQVKIDTKQVEIDAKQAEIDAKQAEIDKQTLEDQKQQLQKEKGNLEIEKLALDGQKNKLEYEKRELEKNQDILKVSLYAGDIQKKTKKREILHTTAGAGQMIGGALAIAGSAGAGIGAIPGAAVSMGAASIKPGAWAVRKLKQIGRDKNLRGFDNSKKSTDKDQQRGDMAQKLATRRGEKEMQTIFQNLPGVSKDEIKRFISTNPATQMQEEEIKKILGRRHY